MGKDGTEYAIYLPDENEKTMPEKVMLYETFLKPGQKVTLMGSDKPLKYRTSGDGTVVWIPAELGNKPYCENAWVLKIGSN